MNTSQGRLRLAIKKPRADTARKIQGPPQQALNESLLQF
jgi:hypothetical protein